MRITHWRQPRDPRYQQEFKVRDLQSAKIFMEDCLVDGQEYIVPDIRDPNQYYCISKEEGTVRIGREEYGEFLPLMMHDDDMEFRIFKARASINQYFFTRTV